jgi:subtilisin family serine protease
VPENTPALVPISNIRSSLLKTRKWIQEAKEHIKGLNQAPKKANQRVKVAVIDTGVDLANNDLSPYERRIKFLRGNAEDNKDYDGHGTMVVQLLLSLNPNIEVYVYKVADSRGSLSLSLDHIKELAQVSESEHTNQAKITKY